MEEDKKEGKLRSLREVYADLLAAKETAKSVREYFDDYVNADDFVPIQIDYSQFADDVTEEEKSDVARDANIRKFLLHMMSLIEMPQKVSLAIGRTRSLEQLNRIASSLPINSETRKLQDRLSQMQRADKEFAEFDKQAQAILLVLKERGEIVDLKDGEVVDGKFLTTEAIERLRAEKNIKTVLPYSKTGPANQFIAGLYEQAKQASDLVSAGVPVDGENDTEHAGKQKQAIETAAAAMSVYERELSVITRSDGDHLMGVKFNWDDFYAKCKAQGYDVVDFRKETVLEEPLVEEFYRTTVGDAQGRGFEGRSQMIDTLANMPVLDCAIFLPRLLIGPVLRRPQPRVVHFAHAYRAYTAAIMALKSAKAAPSQSELDRINAKTQRDLLKAQKALGSSAIQVPKSWSKNLPANATRTPSRQVVDEAVAQLRAAALDEWHKQVEALRSYYANDVRYRKGEMTEAEMQLIGFKPTCSRENTEGQISAEQLFYKSLWFAVQNLCIGLLHAQEIGILMQLQRNFPIEMREYFMTTRELPDTQRTSPATVERVRNVNERLSLQRAAQTVQWHREGVVNSLYDMACTPVKTESESGKRVLVECVTHDSKSNVAKKLRDVVRAPEEQDLAPPVPDDTLDDRVDPNQEHSPTMRQMRQYYCDIAVLFDLKPEQIDYVRGLGNKTKRRK